MVGEMTTVGTTTVGEMTTDGLTIDGLAKLYAIIIHNYDNLIIPKESKLKIDRIKLHVQQYLL